MTEWRGGLEMGTSVIRRPRSVMANQDRVMRAVGDPGSLACRGLSGGSVCGGCEEPAPRERETDGCRHGVERGLTKFPVTS